MSELVYKRGEGWVYKNNTYTVKLANGNVFNTVLKTHPEVGERYFYASKKITPEQALEIISNDTYWVHYFDGGGLLSGKSNGEGPLRGYDQSMYYFCVVP